MFKTTVESFNIAGLANLSIEEKSDNSGTIKLASDKYPFTQFSIPGWPGVKQTPALEFIEDVRSVYNLILKQQHKR